MTKTGKKEGALAGVAWLGGGQLAGQLITLASRLVLARLLAPEAFGLVAMATVVIAFQDLVTGLGIPQALIQIKQLDERTKSSAFWATLLQGIAVAGLGCVAAPWVAAAFEQPELSAIVMVLAAGGAILAPMRLIESLLVREMIFRAVAIRRAVGKLLGGAVAVAMALTGFGVWSLVAGRLVTSLAALVLVALAARWRPQFVFSMTELRKLASFGAGVTFAGVVHALNKQLPAIVVGKWVGSAELGYLSLAQQVILLPLTYIARPVANVLFSLFSRIQERKTELADAFERWQFGVVAVAGVLPPLAATVSPLAVPLLLGERWAPAVFVFQVLAVPATAQLAVAIVGSALRGLGRVRELAFWTTFAFVLQAGGLAVGVAWGLEGAVIGWSVGSIATLLCGIGLAARAIERPSWRLLRPLIVIALPVAACVGAAWGATHASAAISRWLALAVGSGAGAAAYFAVLALVAPRERRWASGQVAKRWQRRKGSA